MKIELLGSSPDLHAALERYAKELSLSKVRVDHNGDINTEDGVRILRTLTSIVHSYGEEIDGELVLLFDRWAKTISVKTLKP